MKNLSYYVLARDTCKTRYSQGIKNENHNHPIFSVRKKRVKTDARSKKTGFTVAIGHTGFQGVALTQDPNKQNGMRFVRFERFEP